MFFQGPGFYAHPPHPLLHPHLHHPGAFHPHPGPRFNHPIGPGVIQNETLHISVPNTAVGALIGTGGVTIKQMMRDSMAFINVSSRSKLVCHFSLFHSVQIQFIRLITFKYGRVDVF